MYLSLHPSKNGYGLASKTLCKIGPLPWSLVFNPITSFNQQNDRHLFVAPSLEDQHYLYTQIPTVDFWFDEAQVAFGLQAGKFRRCVRAATTHLRKGSWRGNAAGSTGALLLKSKILRCMMWKITHEMDESIQKNESEGEDRQNKQKQCKAARIVHNNGSTSKWGTHKIIQNLWK